MQKTIVITGGCGFIGTNLVSACLAKNYKVIVVDIGTYASHDNVFPEETVAGTYLRIKQDIVDQPGFLAVLLEYKPQWIIHLAAESHVDNSIKNSLPFIHTNVLGAHSVLESFRMYLETSHANSVGVSSMCQPKLLHMSTDEVMGTALDNKKFNETWALHPKSPYSASKASAECLVQAWQNTYDLPVIVVRCSNNFGPYQHTEKFIPTIIRQCLQKKPIPVYGNGEQIRDWLFVQDHVAALVGILESPIHTGLFCIGGEQERTNLQVAYTICDYFGSSYKHLVKHVADRPGHDIRYAVDCSLLKNTINWKPTTRLEMVLPSLVQWYNTIL
jgi:dTDP-glucose 4,6-dehydratase